LRKPGKIAGKITVDVFHQCGSKYSLLVKSFNPGKIVPIVRKSGECALLIQHIALIYPMKDQACQKNIVVKCALK
jgi:hypothetical protein